MIKIVIKIEILFSSMSVIVLCYALATYYVISCLNWSQHHWVIMPKLFVGEWGNWKEFPNKLKEYRQTLKKYLRFLLLILTSIHLNIRNLKFWLCESIGISELILVYFLDYVSLEIISTIIMLLIQFFLLIDSLTFLILFSKDHLKLVSSRISMTSTDGFNLILLPF